MPIAVLTQDRDAGDLVERVGIADLPSSIRPHASCRCDRSAHRAAHSQSFPRSAASPQDPASNRNPIRQHQHWHHGGASLMAGLFLLPLILGVLLIASVLATLLLRFALLATASLCTRHGAWRLSRALGRTTRFVFGAAVGESLAFDWEMSALREAGKIAEAADIARTRVADGSLPPWSRNVAIDLLISAGAYSTALASEPPATMPTNARDALALTLIQVNLAEAEYNVGRWDGAEARLRPLDLACWYFPITRAGLLQQRAWIAAHRGRAAESLDLCAKVDPRGLPRRYRAEFHFTRAAALLAADRVDDAEAALDRGARLARRLSSKRNVLFLRARIAAARGDWDSAARSCREAVHHRFCGQGGAGIVLWAQALRQLGRQPDADNALRLVAQRDPESEAAVMAAQLLAAPEVAGVPS